MVVWKLFMFVFSTIFVMIETFELGHGKQRVT